MRQFDLHEFLGYIAPGMLLLFGAWFIWPEAQQKFTADSLSFGEFGLGIVVAYAIGHLIQGLGNLVEKAWWYFWCGMPTDWLRSKKHELIAPAQSDQVEKHVGTMLSDNLFKLATTQEKHWYSITRQVCAAILKAESNKKVDIFLAYYGLSRGIAAVLLFLLVLSLIVHFSAWKIHVVLAALLVLAIYRMHRFGVIYAREVFVQFLQIHNTPHEISKASSQEEIE